MNKFFQRLLLFEKCEIKTKLSKKEILKKIKSFADSKYNSDYYGRIYENGFVIAERYIKQYAVGHSRNSFAPVAKAKIAESDNITTVSMVIRMNFLVQIGFAPIWFISMFTIVLLPFMLILLHFAFIKPAKRLKEEIENLLREDGIY